MIADLFKKNAFIKDWYMPSLVSNLTKYNSLCHRWLTPYEQMAIKTESILKKFKIFLQSYNSYEVLKNYFDISFYINTQDEDRLDQYICFLLLSFKLAGLELHPQQITAALLCSVNYSIEAQTGEGKTFIAILASAIKYLYQHKVHVFTFNDALSQKDFILAQAVLEPLGIQVDRIADETSLDIKQIQYQAHSISYVTHSTFIFDYLRNFLIDDVQQYIHFRFDCAMVDEADALLIDTATVPHIISIPNKTIDYHKIREAAFIMYMKAYYLITNMPDDAFDFQVDSGHFVLNSIGYTLIHKAYAIPEKNIWDEDFTFIYNIVHNTIQAIKNMTRNIQYAVVDGRIYPIDKDTQRLQTSRVFQGGLQEALLVKENLPFTYNESNSLSITFQNFFRKFSFLSAMSGTLSNDAKELSLIYNINVVIPIPVIKPTNRTVNETSVFYTKDASLKFILFKIVQSKEAVPNRPLLVVCENVDDVDTLSQWLSKLNIRHKTLDHRNIRFEQHIINTAGLKGSLLVSTHIIGRGSDIYLGLPLLPFCLNRKNPIDLDRLTPRRVQQLKEISDEHKEATDGLGGILLFNFSARLAKINRQIIGRVARYGSPGEVMPIVCLESPLFSVYKEFINESMLTFDYSNRVTNLDANVILQKLDIDTTYANNGQRKVTFEYNWIQQQHYEILDTMLERIVMDKDFNRLSILKDKLLFYAHTLPNIRFTLLFSNFYQTYSPLYMFLLEVEQLFKSLFQAPTGVSNKLELNIEEEGFDVSNRME